MEKVIRFIVGFVLFLTAIIAIELIILLAYVLLPIGV